MMQKNDSAEHSSYKMYPNSLPTNSNSETFVNMQRQAFFIFIGRSGVLKWGGIWQIGIYYHILIKQLIGKRKITGTLQSTR